VTLQAPFPGPYEFAAPGLVEALRVAEAALAPMPSVAVVDGRVVGHVPLSATRSDAPRRTVDVLSLSPLGVVQPVADCVRSARRRTVT